MLLLLCLFCFLRIRRPPRSTRTDTLFPYTTLFRSVSAACARAAIEIAREFELEQPVPPARIWRLTVARAADFAEAALFPSFFTPLPRSEEHTSELQSLMRISYAVFCLKKKT